VRWPLVPLAWAGLLTINTIVLIVLGGDALEVLLLAGAAAGSAALAGVMAVRGRARAPELSPATVLAAIAVSGLVIGAELGPWLLLISAGLLALALFGLLREGLR
jgi:hypothetical protein